MSSNDQKTTASELESRRVAEASRQTEWKQPSFLREMFLGRFRLDLIHAFPAAKPIRPEFERFFEEFKRLMTEEIDPRTIDAEGEYPPHLIERLKEIGAFGLKIPTEYGGMGCSQYEYNQLMEWLGSVDGNVCALLSAHQSIGVPQPIKMFGTDEQKQRFLTRCVRDAISAFALTEPGVGSDPARLMTTALLTEDGESYIINGEKLWCTNGTLADLLVVMACHPTTRKISAFVVEADAPGVSVDHRCRFMGLRALSNAVISFRDVRVPRDNLIGAEGMGLKIALVTLNTGRLTIPASCVGGARLCLEMVRRWSGLREQWGKAIGKHEALAHMITDIASTTFAMEAMSDLACRLADRGDHDIRLEAAAAKEFNTTRFWHVIDRTLQVRGGRGYETEASLTARGDAALPIERMMRDARINTLFEGSSEIMHLFMAREAVDRHLQVAGDVVDPTKTVGDKLAALPRIAAFYATWYPARWLGWGWWPRYQEFGRLARHLRFVERRTRKLARQVFHGMIRHGARLEKKQAFLFRIVDIGIELSAMAIVIAKVRSLEVDGRDEATAAAHLADTFCRDARRRIDGWFSALWRNDDDHKYGVARSILAGQHTWLEHGIQNMPYSDDDLLPRPSDRPERTEDATRRPAELVDVAERP